VALLAADGSLTYAELAARADERAAALRRQGLRPGQLVLCSVAVPASEWLTMRWALAQQEAALLPLGAGVATDARQTLIAATGTEWVWEAPTLLHATGITTADEAYWPEDPLQLIACTSGSTGAPKAAMLTRGQVASASAAVAARLALGRGDLWLCCLPLQHIGALAIGDRCAHAGATLLLQQGFQVAAMGAALRDYPVTHLSLVPPMLARLLEAGIMPPPTLRVALLGGQALERTLAQRALTAGWPLYLGYGMSETCALVASRAVRAAAGAATDAVDTCTLEPLPDVRLAAPPCGAEPGRLRLSAPMLMAGYANPRRVRGLGLDADGWLTTADHACLTPEGALRIIGRADERLIVAGVKVSPAEIEERLRQAPGVTDCLVVGLPEPVWGQRLAVLYVGTVSRAALEVWCRARLPSVQRPRAFVRLNALPWLPSGKPDRRRALALADAALGAGQEVFDVAAVAPEQ